MPQPREWRPYEHQDGGRLWHGGSVVRRDAADGSELPDGRCRDRGDLERGDGELAGVDHRAGHARFDRSPPDGDPGDGSGQPVGEDDAVRLGHRGAGRELRHVEGVGARRHARRPSRAPRADPRCHAHGVEPRHGRGRRGRSRDLSGGRGSGGIRCLAPVGGGQLRGPRHAAAVLPAAGQLRGVRDRRAAGGGPREAPCHAGGVGRASGIDRLREGRVDRGDRGSGSAGGPVVGLDGWLGIPADLRPQYRVRSGHDHDPGRGPELRGLRPRVAARPDGPGAEAPGAG